MIPEMKFEKKQVKKHILFWLVIIAYLNIDAPVNGPWPAKIIGGALESFNYIFVFYTFNLFLIPNLYIKKRKAWSILCILISYCIYGLITCLNYLLIIPQLGGYSFHQSFPVYYLLLDDLFYFFIVSYAGIALFYYRYSIYHVKKQSEKEKMILVKELNFLKNQFNSHITFNVLNYCYSKVHKILPHIAETIALFSENLRYALESKPGEKVLLSDELAQINNFISLQKSFNNKVKVEYCFDTDSKEKYIYPRILNTIVENAFLTLMSEKDKIHVNLVVNENNIQLNIKVEYAQKQTIKTPDARLDLNHILQTLNFSYPDKHSLNQELRDDAYTIDLVLKIDDYTTVPSKNLSAVNLSEQKDTSLYKLNKKQIIRHTVLWIIIIAYSHLYCDNRGSLYRIIINTFIYINFIFVFYSIRLYIFPRYWGNNTFLLLSLVLCILILYWCISYLIFKEILPGFGHTATIAEYSLTLFLKERFYYFAIFSSAAVFAFFSRYGVFKIKQQEQKEKMLLGKELYYLKNQFNSPLTFSFLSYCTENIKDYSPETARSIGLFSDMLQYTHQTMPEEKVPLKKEIDYINNFISIQKLLSEKVYVEFTHVGDIVNNKILSRILVTFVENAFKHGLYNDPSCPLQINMRVSDTILLFSIKNKISPSKRIDSTRKGIENVTQILDLYYADKYELKKHTADNMYSLELWMELKEEVSV